MTSTDSLRIARAMTDGCERSVLMWPGIMPRTICR
jgi:hypothetical protein